MAFMDRFKKQYMVKTRCFNCGHVQDCKIPKGMTIDSYLKTESALCENCGNPTLRRVMMSQVAAPASARAPMVQRRPTLPPLTPPQRKILQQSRKPHPLYRPQLPPEEYQEVEYPVDEPVHESQDEPEWKPKKINFWTGKEEQ